MSSTSQGSVAGGQIALRKEDLARFNFQIGQSLVLGGGGQEHFLQGGEIVGQARQRMSEALEMIGQDTEIDGSARGSQRAGAARVACLSNPMRQEAAQVMFRSDRARQAT